MEILEIKVKLINNSSRLWRAAKRHEKITTGRKIYTLVSGEILKRVLKLSSSFFFHFLNLYNVCVIDLNAYNVTNYILKNES